MICSLNKPVQQNRRFESHRHLLHRLCDRLKTPRATLVEEAKMDERRFERRTSRNQGLCKASARTS